MDALAAPLLTERLLIRPFTLEDAEEAFQWFSDDEVMRFIPGGRDRTVADARRRITRYLAHGDEHHFTKGVATDRQTGELLGDGGLYYLPGGPRVELGFRFARRHWGRGYATEMAAAWMEKYQSMFPGAPLHAIVHPDHARSQRVLTKLGFAPLSVEKIYGWKMLVYRREFTGNPPPAES